MNQLTVDRDVNLTVGKFRTTVTEIEYEPGEDSCLCCAVVYADYGRFPPAWKPEWGAKVGQGEMTDARLSCHRLFPMYVSTPKQQNHKQVLETAEHTSFFPFPLRTRSYLRRG